MGNNLSKRLSRSKKRLLRRQQMERDQMQQDHVTEIDFLERVQGNEMQDALEIYGEIRHQENFMELKRQHRAQKKRQKQEQLEENQQQQLQQFNEQLQHKQPPSPRLIGSEKVVPTTSEVKSPHCQIEEMRRRHRDETKQLKCEQKGLREEKPMQEGSAR